jgi:signal transduction histidine kinase
MINTKMESRGNEVINGLIDRYLERYKMYDQQGNLYVRLAVGVYEAGGGCREEILHILDRFRKPLTEVFDKEQIHFLLEHKGDVLDKCCDMTSHDLFSGIRVNQVPEVLAEFYIRLADIQPGTSVFLPFCGLGEEIFHLPDGCDYSGVCENADIWALLQIRLWAKGKSGDSIMLGNPFDVMGTNAGNDAPQAKRHDLILMLTPWGGMGQDETGAKRFLEVDALKSAYNNLNEGGRLLAIVPVIITRMESERDLRTLFLEQKSVKMVVSLPHVMKAFTYAPFCIMVLTKTQNERIMMVDGADYVTPTDHKRLVSIDIERLLNDIDEQKDTCVKAVDYADLTDGKIYPGMYLTPKIPHDEQTTLYQLGDLIEMMTCPRSLEDAPVALVGMNNLTTDYHNCELSASQLTERQVPYPVQTISESCLLVAMIFNVKVAKFVATPLMPSIKTASRIFAFQLKSSVVSEKYLLRMLVSDLLQQQITRLTGNTMTMSVRDLLRMQIPVPPIEVQNELVQQDLVKSFTKAQQDLIDLQTKHILEVRSRKHSLAQVFSSLDAWINALNASRKRHGGILKDTDIVNDISEVTNAECMEKMVELSRKVANSLKRLTDFDEIDTDITEIDLDSFIADYCVKYGCNSTFIQEPAPYNQDVRIVFSAEALEKVFNNIVSNAEQHGFEGKRSEEHKIRFSWCVKNDAVVVTISNNGKPLPEEIKPDRIFVDGFSTCHHKNGHYGLGGSDILHTMERFKGTATISSTPNEEFTVSYQLIFKNIATKD